MRLEKFLNGGAYIATKTAMRLEDWMSGAGQPALQATKQAVTIPFTGGPEALNTPVYKAADTASGFVNPLGLPVSQTVQNSSENIQHPSNIMARLTKPMTEEEIQNNAMAMGMAGYNKKLNMSNNAVEARENGLLPRSAFKNLPKGFLQYFVPAEEWHHTGTNYQKTNLYDPEIVKKYATAENISAFSELTDFMNQLENKTKKERMVEVDKVAREWNDVVDSGEKPSDILRAKHAIAYDYWANKKAPEQSMQNIQSAIKQSGGKNVIPLFKNEQGRGATHHAYDYGLSIKGDNNKIQELSDALSNEKDIWQKQFKREALEVAEGKINPLEDNNYTSMLNKYKLDKLLDETK